MKRLLAKKGFILYIGTVRKKRIQTDTLNKAQLPAPKKRASGSGRSTIRSHVSDLPFPQESFTVTDSPGLAPDSLFALFHAREGEHQTCGKDNASFRETARKRGLFSPTAARKRRKGSHSGLRFHPQKHPQYYFNVPNPNSVVSTHLFSLLLLPHFC